MKRPWYARGAKSLLLARQSGLTQDAPVEVSLCSLPGQIEVTPDMPTDALDWRMLVDLTVWVWADATVPLKRLLATLDRIARCRPAMLILRFESAGVHDVEVGTGLHLPAVLDVPAQHAFEWVPINLTGSAIGTKLRKALIYQNPRWAVL